MLGILAGTAHAAESEMNVSVASPKKERSAVIKDFSIKTYHNEDGTGKIKVKAARKGGDRLKLNLGCSNTEMTLHVKDAVRNCDSWITFNKKKGSFVFTYDKLVDKALTMQLVLDVYNGRGARNKTHCS